MRVYTALVCMATFWQLVNPTGPETQMLFSVHINGINTTGRRSDFLAPAIVNSTGAVSRSFGMPNVTSTTSEHREHNKSHEHDKSHKSHHDPTVSTASPVKGVVAFWDYDYIVGGSVLGCILFVGLLWWKYSLWTITSMEASSHRVSRWSLISTFALLMHGPLQFTPFVCLAFHRVSKSRGLPWVVHWLYASALAFGLPVASFGKHRVIPTHWNEQEERTFHSAVRSFRVKVARVCQIPIIGCAGTVIGEVYGYFVQFMYPLDVFLDSMNAAIGLHIGYENAWWMVGLLFAGLIVQGLAVAVFMNFRSSERQVHSQLEEDCLLSTAKKTVFWICVGCTPSYYDEATECVLSIARFFTEDLWQFLLGVDMAIHSDAGLPVYISLAVSLFMGIKHVITGLTYSGFFEPAVPLE